MSKYIAPYITDKEYRCSCCYQYPPGFYDNNGTLIDRYPVIYSEIFESFLEIREAWGRAITISCGYRCPKQNKEARGVRFSLHLFGLALDLDLPDVKETEQLEHLIKLSHKELRMGVYKKPKKVMRDDGKIVEIPQSFIHIDTAYTVNVRLDHSWKRGIIWEG